MIKSEKQKLGEILKQARKNKGLTQSEVAEKLGVTFQAISNYERGTNSVDNDTLEKLCLLYEIPYLQTIDSIDHQAIAEKLKAARTKNKLTQLQVSELSGIPVGTIRGYESGKRPIPDECIGKFCLIYGLSTGDLIEKRIHYFRFMNRTVFVDIHDNIREFVCDLRNIADEIENSIDNIPDQLAEISLKFRVDITEHF
mgnify:CR=1 FL=1